MHLFFTFIIAIMFTIVNEPFSFVIWFFMLFVGNKISVLLCSSIKHRANFITIYFIISIIGLLICIDNYYNFGVLTGFAADDERFFNSLLHLIGQSAGINKLEVSPFAYFLTIIAYPLSFFKDVALTDVISVNWMFTALIIIFIDKLSYLIFKQNIPFAILLLGFIFQFILMDTITRLYRDNVLLFATVLSTIYILNSEKVKTLYALIPIFLLRMANIVFPALLILFARIKIKKKRTLFFIVIISVFIANYAIQPLIKYAIMYGSDISRQDRYINAFNDVDDAYKTRFGSLDEKEDLMSQAYSSTSLSSISLRIAFSYFFPLTLQSPYSSMPHYKLGRVDGFYIYYILNWINILSMIIVTPMLIIGCLKPGDNEKLKILLISYLLFWLLVLLISGQGRHLCGAFIFNTIFITNGYFYIKNKLIYRNISVILSCILLVSVMLYNII